jgi:phage-related protein
MPNNSIIVQNWYAGTSYGMYEITAGLDISNVSYYGPMYWSTVNNNVGNNPSGQFVYAINSYSRSQDLASIDISYTGTYPNFARGSFYAITGLPDPWMNSTGMVLSAAPVTVSSGGGVIQLQFLNPGPYAGSSSTSLGAINAPEPSWTTGFFWTPGYNSPWEVQQSVISVKFENAYEQRQPQGIANNISMWNMEFSDRTDLEAKGIMAFVQNLAGVYSTPLLIPPNRLYNNPNLKYVLSNPKNNPKSYNINDVTVTCRQVLEY